MSDTERDEFLEQLYELYFDRLVRFCRWYLRAYPDLYYMAEECVQDVFCRATKEYRNLLDHPDIKGWLFRCSKNRVLNMLTTYFSHLKKTAYSIDERDAPELCDPNDSFRSFEENESYHHLIDRLYDVALSDEKAVIRDFMLHGYSMKEVAERTGKSESAVKSLLFRFRRRFKKIYFSAFLLLGATFWFLNN